MQPEPFALERWMTTYETRVSHDIAESGILPLSVADLLAFEPPAARDRLLHELTTIRLGYSEARGSEALRAALAATYAQPGTTAEEILVTTGAIEANFLLFTALLSPGDHVVAVYPAYQQLYSLPAALGCEVSRWELRAEDGFRFDLAQLPRLITPRTRLIVVNTPHNPTGALLSAAELRWVYDLAAEAGAVLLCDEAYRWLELPGGEPLAPPARDLGPAAVSVGTLSKPFGLPGLRVGWFAGPAELVQRCWGLRDYVSLSPAKLSDALAVLALRHREAIVARNQRIVAANLAAARAWFAENADLVAWTEPKAGLLALLRYALDLPSMELANRLAEEASVMLAPGAAFGCEHHLRIGIGQDPAVFAEGLARTAELLRRLVSEGTPPRSDWRPAPAAAVAD